MSSKVLVLFAVLCVLGSCWGVEETTQGLTRHEDIPIEPLGVPSDSDLRQDATFWRFWKLWKWDTQRTVTRRESSLITARRYYSQDDRYDFDTISTARGGHSTVQLNSESNISLITRPIGSVEKELVTLMFEGMLPSIIRSWDVIHEQKAEDNYGHMGKTPSDVTVTGGKKKKTSTLSTVKMSKTKSTKSRSKLDIGESGQTDPMTIVWWSGPDEKVVIRFKNGNKYEGKVSYKCMHGEGRFQWADGTIYLGEFKDNEMNGKGMMQWKNDSWYEGEFAGNLRHGHGLFVDSRTQRSYHGGWHCGTKHGKGTMHYKFSKSYYDGDWVHNVRHGFGTREYCQMSGYQGEWDRYVRDGRGLMIWPNHDFYKGEWKNGIMSGYGFYIWDAYYNNSLSLPSINMYRGRWFKGERNGYGVLHLGLGLGSHYKGEFKDNKKNGSGKFITNNGYILKGKKLFIDDNMGPVECDEKISRLECSNKRTHGHVHEPYDFNICDSTAGLKYHVIETLKNLDRQVQIRAQIINEYIENNKYCESDFNSSLISIDRVSAGIDDELIEFEVNALRKAVRCYENKLKEIYYTYATVCNTEDINFTPILIRLFLWQFYYDCDIHEKGMTLVQINEIYCQNPEWLAKTPHGPFERVYLWQFLHSLISIACHLHAKTYLPGPRPETILANAFRYFMDNDAIPSMGLCKGHLTQSFGLFVPLKALYKLYRTLGEPHTVRDFLCAVREPPHLYMTNPQPDLVDAPDEGLPLGRNIYIFADDIFFVTPDPPREKNPAYIPREKLHLFNFGNLSSKTIIKIFANIFPGLCDGDKIMDLDIKITFFEFYEAFIICTEESNRVREEELRWRELFEENLQAQVVTPPRPNRPNKTL